MVPSTRGDHFDADKDGKCDECGSDRISKGVLGDVDPEDFGSYADYVSELRNRGNKALRDYRETLCVRCEVTPDLPGYRTAFDLGDLVAVDAGHGYGLRAVRVTEADEIWENGTFRVEITLGERLMNVKRFIKRELTANRAVK